MKKSKKPVHYVTRSGTTHLMKGQANGLKYYVWDLVDNCRLDKCEAYHVCEFAHRINMVKEDGTPKKCRVMYWWLKGASDVYFKDVHNMDQITVWRIGMRLMQMNRTLCKMVIAEAGLDSYVSLNNRGNITCISLGKIIAEVQMKIDALEMRIFGKEATGRTPELPFEIPQFIVGRKKK